VEKKYFSPTTHRHVVCAKKDVNRKRIIRLTVLIQFHDWDGCWLITNTLVRWKHTGTRNTQVSLSKWRETNIQSVCVLFCLFLLNVISLSWEVLLFNVKSYANQECVYVLFCFGCGGWSTQALGWPSNTDTPNSLYYYTHSQDTQNHFGGAVTNDAQVQSREIHVRCQNGVSSVSIRIFVNFKKKSYRRMSNSFGWVKKWCVCCCNGASFSNGVSERHWTRPLSVKDWLTLTQQTPVSRTLPPVR
jgi:hypothetical protein